MSEFVNIDGRIVPKPKGFDYDLINGKIYDLTGMWNPALHENGDFNMPEKVYNSEKDTKFRELVLKRFNNSKSQATGILLSGEKGTGKTIQAKLIAKESGLPIINIPSQIERKALINFFKSFNTPVCVIFDEFDKYFETSDLLSLLDGINKTTKMLVLFTCNDLKKVSEYLKDRCSRIRYIRKFTSKDNESFLPEIITELGLTNHKDELIKFCNENIMYPTIDNIKAFLTEYKEYLTDNENISLSEVIEYLNITLK